MFYSRNQAEHHLWGVLGQNGPVVLGPAFWKASPKVLRGVMIELSDLDRQQQGEGTD